jgi:hypothetical protein
MTHTSRSSRPNHAGSQVDAVRIPLGRLGLAALASALVACSGSGPASSASQDLSQQAQADARELPGEDEPSARERAERGLAISPVPLSTDGLSRKQRTLVGIGSYIVNAASDCSACHSTPAGFLSGGNPFFLDAQGHVVWTRNLTPDPATGLKLTLDQFKEAIRTGKDFHPGATRILVVMPWTTLRWASDADLDAIYAYLRAIPPVANAVPPDNKDLPLPASIPFPGKAYTDGNVVRPLRGDHRSFDGRRGLSISPLARPAGLEDEALEAFGVGSYVVNALMHCNDCHTHPDRTPDSARVNTAAFLTGGTVFAVPPPLQPVFKQVRTMSANLKGAAYGFFVEPEDSYQRFHDLVHTGTHVDETPPRPLGFPMNLVAGSLRNLLDDDLHAVYAYVKGIPATTGGADQPRQSYARLCGADADCYAGETCATATHECVGKPCGADRDCDACQTCDGGGHCQAPAADSACLASAQ